MEVPDMIDKILEDDIANKVTHNVNSENQEAGNNFTLILRFLKSQPL